MDWTAIIFSFQPGGHDVMIRYHLGIAETLKPFLYKAMPIRWNIYTIIILNHNITQNRVWII